MSLHSLGINLKYALLTVYELSEGERQIITVLGLILITGRDNCLFLLDEPDTHLNPNWQRGYIQLLDDFNLNDFNSHIIVASHSPLLVQSAAEVDTFLFKRDDKIIKIDSDDHSFANWRIDQVYASDYFDFENTRSPESDEFMEEREALLSKPDLREDDIKRLNELEEKYGGLPSGETLNDFKAIHLLRSFIEEAEKNDKDSEE